MISVIAKFEKFNNTQFS